ncbi:MAG: HEAT repeat domain-containing protein [Deltaproteobacteria bacterium]|nr:MAG: HEAT repeat domain-containing protein [Deltaproteobacteria bacterium]
MPRRALKVARALAFIRPLRLLSWGLLVLSVVLSTAGLPEWARARITSGQWPRLLVYLGPAAFAAFLLGFSVYRFALVRARRYNAAKAFLQVGLGFLVLAFMVATARQRHAALGMPRRAAVDLRPLLDDPRPELRAVACEALAHRPKDDPARPRAAALAESDPDPRVRAACARVP